MNPPPGTVYRFHDTVAGTSADYPTFREARAAESAVRAVYERLHGPERDAVPALPEPPPTGFAYGGGLANRPPAAQRRVYRGGVCVGLASCQPAAGSMGKIETRYRTDEYKRVIALCKSFGYKPAYANAAEAHARLTFATAGDETGLFALADALRERGWDVTVHEPRETVRVAYRRSGVARDARGNPGRFPVEPERVETPVRYRAMTLRLPG